MEHSNIDPAVQRLLDFVESQGGPAEVSKRMGVRPQLFYNMKEGKSKFSMTTLVEMAATFPGLIDANYILFGVESGAAPVVVQKTQQQPQAATVDVSGAVTARDQIIERQNQLIDKLSNRVEVLELRNETQAEQILRLSTRDFPGSDSQTTAEHFNRTLGQYQEAGAAVIHAIGFEVPKPSPKPTAQIGVLHELGCVEENGQFAVPPRREVEALV